MRFHQRQNDYSILYNFHCRCRKELADLKVMRNDAIIARDASRSQLETEEKNVYAERKKREIELQKVKREAEEKKALQEQRERRLVRLPAFCAYLFFQIKSRNFIYCTQCEILWSFESTFRRM